MSRLTLCLVLLTVLFWGAHLVVYFRSMIIAWVDNRVPYEPAVARLRLLFRKGRR
ncbi:hypothetical protein [Lichenicoccus sp.]|uniref:hypothetical protein n=1 Tax=Lichenicoccus sp. TaxID=2781899 RepID=UPI003D0DEBD9